MDLKNKRIIISKINQIGDVTFGLPLATAIKQAEPSCRIIFLGRAYTQGLIESYVDVDEFVDWEKIKSKGPKQAVSGLRALKADVMLHLVHPDQWHQDSYWIAKKAGIPIRVGTLRKVKSLLTCNRLVSVARKNSGLHETQLDMFFLKSLGLRSRYSLEEIIALRRYKPIPTNALCDKWLDADKFNLILHPKSRAQNREWPTSHFAELIKKLPPDEVNVIVTGSQAEGDMVREVMINPFSHVVDLCGKASLAESLPLIAHADGLIAVSTGPVHLGANMGIHTLGLYCPPQLRSFSAQRWGPVGVKAEVLMANKLCQSCEQQLPQCNCLNSITVDEVLAVITRWVAAKHKAIKTQ